MTENTHSRSVLIDTFSTPLRLPVVTPRLDFHILTHRRDWYSVEAIAKLGSVGKPLMFTQAKLVDDRGNSLADGETGELLLRGPHTSLGYWKNETATRAALDPEGWFRTGDVARRDNEGFFYIVGRIKEMFISRGVNIYPAEIENELLGHESVQDAAVIGAPDPVWGELGVAFIVRKHSGVSSEDLERHLSTRLARYKVPKQFHFVGELPRTAYGKVQKEVLRAQYEALKK